MNIFRKFTPAPQLCNATTCLFYVAKCSSLFLAHLIKQEKLKVKQGKKEEKKTRSFMVCPLKRRFFRKFLSIDFYLLIVPNNTEKLKNNPSNQS